MAASGNPAEINSPASDFELKATDGRIYSLKDFAGEKILVIIFQCNHCPYVKAVMDRFVRLQEKYSDSGVQLVGINSNDEATYPEDSFGNMKLFYGEYKMNYPYLHDATQEVARAYDAACTPDIYVYDESRKLKYHGRLDDNWKDESNVTSNDLEDAIKMLIAGKDPDSRQIPSIGCSIKWKK